MMRFKATVLVLGMVFALVLGTAPAAAQTKISGTIECAKPAAAHQVEVGDRPGHLLMIGQSNCKWSKPMEIAGVQTKEATITAADEASAGRVRTHGYSVETMANGDHFHVRFQGTGTLKEGGLESADGTWSFTNGTGKVKGIKGKGTYKGKGNPDGSVTYEVEGEYTIPEPKAKKS